MNNLALVESKSLREQYVNKVEVLEKVGQLALLPDGQHATVERVANYYDVDEEAISSLIKDHKEELLSDGLIVLTGESLKSLKDTCQIQSKARHLTVIPRRAILRFGMLLRDSEVAKQIRTYLINVEESAPQNQKDAAIEKLLKLNTTLNSEIKDLKNNIPLLIANEIGKYLPIKVYANCSTQFERLINQFHEKVYGIIPGGYKRYQLFYQHFTDRWLGFSLPCKEELQKDALTQKQYIIDKRFSDMEYFITGIATETIILSDGGMWVTKDGYESNNIEFNRVVREWDHSCAYCNATGVALYPEHILPKSNPESSNQIWNVIPACKQCNDAKTNMKLTDWYRIQPFYSEDVSGKIKYNKTDR